MKTLVTGSDGLIGSSIRNLGLTDYYFATRKDADLQNFDQTMSLFSEVKPKKVIHLAALVGGIGGNSVNSADYFMGNIRINTNTLEAARLNGVERLVSLCQLVFSLIRFNILLSHQVFTLDRLIQVILVTRILKGCWKFKLELIDCSGG